MSSLRETNEAEAPTQRAGARLSGHLALAISAVALLAALGGRTFAVAQGGGIPNTTFVPPGTVVAYAGAVVPPGWLLADGAEVSRTTQAGLFEAIGTTYGAGNGTTTFNLPDYRGRTLAGKGTGADVDSLTDSEGLAVDSRKVAHRHGQSLATSSTSNHNHGFNEGGFPVTYSGNADGEITAVSGGGHHFRVNSMSGAGGHSHSISGTIGDASGPLNNSAYHVVSYIIKD